MILKRFFRTLIFLKDFYLAKQNPLRIQKKILREILKRNKDTLYGKEYGFSEIKSIQDFQKKVPIVIFEDISSYIQKMKEGQENILVKDKVVFFATSSGTTSNPKFIPITEKRMDFHRGEVLLWAKYMIKNIFRVFGKKTLFFAASHYNGNVKCGIPYGNITGYLVNESSNFIKKRLIIKPEFLKMKNFKRKIKKIAISSLQEDIGHFGFASAIEVILFFDYLKENREKLIKIISRKNKKRARYLRSLKDFRPIDIWPNLWLINCVQTKVNESYLKTIIEKIGKKDIIIKDQGVLASEGRISMGITDFDRAGFVSANEIFFEFMEKKKNGFAPPITIDKIRKSKQYKVIMTTFEGLYRYDIADIVKVVGFERKLPIIRFVSRNRFLNVAEEHAPEKEIIRSVEEALNNLKIKFKFFTVLPYFEDLTKKPRYEIMLELKEKINNQNARKIIKRIDDLLQKYILTYKKTRIDFNRMDMPILSIVENGSYDFFHLKQSLKSSQFKPVLVTEDTNFKKKFKIIKIFK